MGWFNLIDESIPEPNKNHQGDYVAESELTPEDPAIVRERAVARGRLAAVLDFAGLGIGDPACDTITFGGELANLNVNPIVAAGTAISAGAVQTRRDGVNGYIAVSESIGPSNGNRYTLTFPAGQLPPVNAFWSVTMYDAQDFYLVPNPINRYSVGDRTRGLQFDPDGGLTLAVQHEAPANAANWLPAPAGRFYCVLRLYHPQDGVRGWRRGDSLRQIVWKKVARTGQLVSRETVGSGSQELWLDWADTLAAGRGAEGLELRLSRMTRWVLEAEQRALPYAFRMNGREFAPSAGAAHQAACLRALALFGARA